MQKCKTCGALMIDAAMYDPEGTTPLDMVEIDGRFWACRNPECNTEKAEPIQKEGENEIF